MTDKYGGLWFGTKGDGLLHVHDYEGGMDASATTVYSPVGRQDAHLIPVGIESFKHTH